MSKYEMFKFFEELIKIDKINITNIINEFEKDQDYIRKDNVISRLELYDGATDNIIYLEKPLIITFDDFLRRKIISEINNLDHTIEDEESKILSVNDNIVLLVACISKVDTYLHRVSSMQGDYAEVITEFLRKFSFQLHARYDKEIDVKIKIYSTQSGQSSSKILLDIWQNISIYNDKTKENISNSNDRDEKEPPRKDIRLKFKFNRNQITILFMMLKDNGGFDKETIDSDIARFLENNC